VLLGGVALAVSTFVLAWRVLTGGVRPERLLGQARFYDRLGFTGVQLLRGLPLILATTGSVGIMIALDGWISEHLDAQGSPSDLAFGLMITTILVIACVFLPLCLVAIRTGRPRWLIPRAIRGKSSAEIERMVRAAG